VDKFIEIIRRFIGIGGSTPAVHRGKQLDASAGCRRKKA
jgi:hypothetical protein